MNLAMEYRNQSPETLYVPQRQETGKGRQDFQKERNIYTISSSCCIRLDVAVSLDFFDAFCCLVSLCGEHRGLPVAFDHLLGRFT
jgi:hypothetical protein